MSGRKWVALNWSPFATNVLDADKYDLCTPDGSPIDFRRSGMEFVMWFHGVEYRTDDNLKMSYWMNMHEIGGIKKPASQAAKGER